ncbi:MAG: MBL fold metallo-hydrolase [Alphaproteobacteria bacterium]|nr:MBL fold metallo-hydrolase [Alphaproteobacteria bacterium]
MKCQIAYVASLVAASLLALPASAHPVADDPATAQFLANEAVLVFAGETKILFDPLYTQSYNNYPLVDPAMRAALMAGEAPYDGVDAVFISHIHGDHFDAEDLNTYLATHSETVAVIPFQARLDMRAAANWDESLEARLHVMSFISGPQSLTIGADGDARALQIEAVHIPHAGGAGRAHIQNMAYRVTLRDEATVMHMGDATPDAAPYAAQHAHFQARTTHRAFPPYWLIQQWGGEVLRERINADEVTGIHVPIRLPGAVTASSEDFFTRPGEQRGVHPHED